MNTRYYTIAILLLTGSLFGLSVQADSTKASSWEGRIVVTQEGELLGRVEDLAVNIGEKTIDFVVVSIGSFLVDDNLIAVHPDALGLSEDGQYLVIYADDLSAAARFGADHWPVRATVMPSKSRLHSEAADAQENEPLVARNAADSNRSRVATISNGRRTSTLKSGMKIERQGAELEVVKPVGVRPKTFKSNGTSGPLLADSEFDRRDEDGDGYLSRSEIGLRLNQDIRFKDYDLDGNDGIDAFEFQLLKERG